MYLRALCGYDLSLDVVHAPLPLERDSRSPPCSVAQSVSSLASRNLLRRQDAADWIPGVLGIHSARTKASLAILKMDGGNGTVRASQAKESVKFFATGQPSPERVLLAREPQQESCARRRRGNGDNSPFNK